MNQATSNPSDPFVTKSMLDAFATKFVTKAEFNSQMAIIDFRFNTLEVKIDAGFARMDEKYDRIMSAIDSFMGRVENIEMNDAARDSQLDRHDRWHRQLAGTLHLKLE